MAKTQSKKKKKRSSEQAPPERRPLQRSRRRANTSYAEDSASRAGMLPGDLTIRAGSNVAVIKPDWGSGDSLIFRPLPCLTDTPKLKDAKFMPYRDSIEANQYTDWMRAPICASYWGTVQDDRYTFILYDHRDVKENGYDRRLNPAMIIWNAADKIVKQMKNKQSHPPKVPGMSTLSWLGLTEGQSSILNRPKKVYYYQGLIFKRGDEVFVGQGKMPKGAAPEDKAQIIQLSSSAGESVEKQGNQLNLDWTGSEHNYEKAMHFGDLVSMKHGRFIRVLNLAKGGVLRAELVDDSEASWSMGADQYNRGEAEDKDKGGFEKYTVTLDKVMRDNGRKTKYKANDMPDELVKLLKPKIVFWDEILHYPTHEELFVMLAKSLRGIKGFLCWALREVPEFEACEDAQKILRNATQFFVSDDLAEDEDTEPPKKKKKRTSAVVPDGDDPEDDEEYEEGDEYEDDDTDGDEEDDDAEDAAVNEEEGEEADEEDDDDGDADDDDTDSSEDDDEEYEDDVEGEEDDDEDEEDEEDGEEEGKDEVDDNFDDYDDSDPDSGEEDDDKDEDEDDDGEEGDDEDDEDDDEEYADVGEDAEDEAGDDDDDDDDDDEPVAEPDSKEEKKFADAFEAAGKRSSKRGVKKKVTKDKKSNKKKKGDKSKTDEDAAKSEPPTGKKGKGKKKKKNK